MARRLLASTGLSVPSAGAAETLRYVAFVSDGVKAGEQVVVHGDDGWTRVHFVFKDNGRGPELDEQFRLADDGTYANYDVEGTSTYGGPVDEHFVRNGTHAKWHSRSEHGHANVTGTALYAPMNGTFETASVAVGVLARATISARRCCLPAR